jgi:hypothetical protein
VGAHTSVNAGAANANENAQVPAGPSGVCTKSVGQREAHAKGIGAT